jgi:predicted dehydrogenase
MLNAAVVGLGWWGKTVVEALAGSSKLRVTRAVGNVNPAAAAYAKDHGLAYSSRYEDALEDRSIGAVILCTPNLQHVDQVVRAAAAGKHVFCEKPLAMDRKGAEQAVAACNAAKVVLGVGHERRFEPPMLELRRLVTAGTLGTLLQVEANFSQDKFLGLPADNWRGSPREAPAGPMTATGIHLLDLAVSFLGTPERVFVNVHQLGSQLRNGDTLGALVTFKGGANALLTAILATPYFGRFCLFGSQGWAEIRDKSHPDKPTGSTLTTCLRGQTPSVVDYAPVSAVGINLEAFADAALGRAAYPMPQSEMIANIAALEAIFKSAESGVVEAVEA